jgi:predicted dehydrogenase
LRCIQQQILRFHGIHWNITGTGRAIYGSYQQMFEEEVKLPEDERMDFVSIVTPNHVHFEPAKLALENGFHVVIEKPLAFSLEEAVELQRLWRSTGNILALTHTYTGYPMVKEAKHFVESGKLGKIRKIYVEYPQGWLATPLEQEGNKQASWRTDPSNQSVMGGVWEISEHMPQTWQNM